MFISLVFLLFTLIPMVSAWEFDNVKTYDSTTKTLTFKNSLLGIPTTEIATARLDTPQNFVVGAGYQKVAQFTINPKTDYTDMLSKIDLYDMTKRLAPISKDIDVKSLKIVPVEVNDYKEVCNPFISKNESYDKNCSRVVIGTHFIDTEVWEDYDLSLKADAPVTVGLFTNVEVGEKVEWIPTMFGIRSLEWASWSASLNASIRGYWRFNQSAGNYAPNDAVGSILNMTFDGSQSWVEGKKGNGILYNNGAKFQSAPYDIVNTNGYVTGFTFNFWYNQTADKTGDESGIMINGGASADGDIYLVWRQNAIFGQAVDSTGARVLTGYTPGLGVWGMATYTINSTGLYLYNNGVEVDKVFFAGTWSFQGGAYPVCFFNDNGNTADMDSVIFDEMAIWNRTLTPSELATLYNNTFYAYQEAGPATTPIITIDYPSTGNYNYFITHLNVSVGANTSAMNCWWSNDSGTTNQSFDFCGQNVTTSSREGSNTWQVWVNDTNGQNNDEVTFVVHTDPPDLIINYPIGTNLLTDYITGTQITKNLSFNATDPNLGLNKCWYYFYEDKNYTGINISIKMDYGLGTYDPVYCYNFNTNTYNTLTGTIKDNFVSFNIPGVCIDKSRINLKIQGGLNALSEGTVKVYDISLNNTFYNLALINYACENTTSGNVTGCGKGVDQNFATSADFQENGLFGGTAYIYLNYTLGNYTLIGSCGWNTTAISNISLNKNYTLWLFANDSVGNINFTNTSFIYKSSLVQNNMTYTPDTYETSKEDFILNFTYNTDLYQLTLANLFYNGTKYATTKSEIGGGQVVFNKTLYVPLVPSQQNISFKWQIGLVNTTGTTYINSSLTNQSVGTINLSACMDDGTIAWNITMFDEQTKERVVTYDYKSTLFYALSIGGNIFKNVSWGNNSVIEQRFCISVNKTFYVNGDIQYANTSLGYDTKIYSPLNYPLTNITSHLFLYSLLASQSTSFIIHVQNQALMPLEGYTVYVNRWYPETGSYKTVQTVTTNSNGEGVAFLEIEDVEYQFFVYNTNKDLVYISERSVIIPKETPYTIYLTVGDMLPNPIIYMGNLTGLTYSLTFDKTTNDVSFIYTDTNISFSKARLYVVKKNPKGDVPICNMNNSDPNGVIICDLSGNSTGQYGATAYIYRGKEYFVYNMLFEIETFSDYVGLLGVFGAFLILLVAGFAFAYNEVAGIVSLNLAVIFLNVIGLVHFGGIFISAMLAVSAIILVVLERG